MASLKPFLLAPIEAIALRLTVLCPSQKCSAEFMQLNKHVDGRHHSGHGEGSSELVMVPSL